MAAHDIQVRKGWQQFNGVNLGYMFEQYERYEEDPSQVDDKLRAFFDKWGAYSESGSQDNGERLNDSVNLKKREHVAVQASFLAESIRRNGHLIADIMPFDTERRPEGLFNLEDFDLTKQDLQHLSAELLSPHYSKGLQNGDDAINHLKDAYTGNIAFQFKHIQEIKERKWLFREVETGAYKINLSDSDKTDLLQRLNKVEGFEHFLDKTFKGQKRFSVEGLDTMVPMLDQLVKDAVNAGSKHIFIGMAHRGRLNVLAHVLGKPYELIFSEFHDAPNPELVPSEGSTGINYGWTGDVKYHLGADREIKESASEATITLANNPSHLEFVNPVIEGLTRAAQDDRSKSGFPSHDPDLALPVLIHGDAAFPGQGVVAETINLSGLRGYSTGGTIHLIANNLLGFTTDSHDSRSTTYASDMARGFDVPVIHVNADDPESSLSAMNLAWKYRKAFGKDVVIDLIGYRRYGHNEMDEPLATQPSLYKIIQKHPTVFELYGEKLRQESKVTDEQLRKMRKEFTDKLNQQFDKIKGNKRETIDGDMSPPDVVTSSLERYQKNISPDSLEKVNEELLAFPESFSVFPKLKRILERRRDAFRDGAIDWGHAEALAFATIIKDGIPIRLTGQDSERGTFSHRHLILHDYETGDTFSPMHYLSNANASFALHNSPLSETACLGFEYGYNVEAPETLTIWEAQYGDFANGAQVILDQFISSGRAKWSQKSGLVLLLPHGYEGQGPEHSSARLERFLTLAAENNWHVANVTKASQYYHLLRRQAHSLGTDYVRPLILMAPKSLIRNERVVSSAKEMTEDEFKPVLVSPDMKASNQVERVILTQGKIGVELETAIAGLDEQPDWLIHVRIEELYPFPSASLRDVLQACGNVKEVIWLQEEPQNMGAWTYVMPYLQGLFGAEKISFTGRRRRSSPAEGDPKVHKLEHERMINSVLDRSSNLKGDSHNDRD
ncbi:2-oxoglutarate dehydrogenase E1 component [Salisediminibacterium selenitireducens]|uniref:2-oxoglutarate dehydrogenase E1 component n=1 Tax=Bacillus selenitireducens (strain ATCC 700615 / DSM 15326 / MLS10) TaxID=439292 RepID=D6XUR3_BACIE|nr:2-oxoglutarate dehydrogenase E1 component [Salisediminibacterium selenitireducens]ADH99549.1 2-oxoglutarate dehydrogenase, E1 subunit [[Bacillus] selenitireducens MLS10]